MFSLIVNIFVTAVVIGAYTDVALLYITSQFLNVILNKINNLLLFIPISFSDCFFVFSCLWISIQRTPTIQDVTDYGGWIVVAKKLRYFWTDLDTVLNSEHILFIYCLFILHFLIESYYLPLIFFHIPSPASLKWRLDLQVNLTYLREHV